VPGGWRTYRARTGTVAVVVVVGVGVVVAVAVVVAVVVVAAVGVGVAVVVGVVVGVGVVVAVGVVVWVVVGEVGSKEVEMDPLIGKQVVVLCANYIYTGVLEAVGHDVLVLSSPSIIYETGAWSDDAWRDAQRLPARRITIERTASESMFELDRSAARER